MSSNVCEELFFNAEFDAFKAYAEALQVAKQLSSAEFSEIIKALNAIREQHTYTKDKDDIILTESRFLTYLSANLTKQLLIGRSNLDQILTKLHIWLRFAIQELKKHIFYILETGLIQIEYNSDVLLPFNVQECEEICTAKPFSVWLLHHLETLRADFQKLQQLELRVNMLPMQSNPQDIDMQLLAQKLGFIGVQSNSATRYDIISDFLYICAGACTHLSQLATDILVYSSEYSIIQLPKFYEEQMISIKVHCTAVFGRLFSAMTLVQENSLQQTASLRHTRKYCMEVYEKLYKSLYFCKQMLKDIMPNEYAIEKLIASKALTTNWFNYLLKKRVKYAAAQAYLQKITQYAEKNAIKLIDIPLEDLQAICPHFGNDVFQFQFVEADQIYENIYQLKNFLAANKQQLFIAK